MKLGPAAFLVASLGALGGSGLGLGCSREARPAVPPEERAPLPPASGTPVGHLIDDATELKLTDAHLGKLRTISDELADQLTADDSEMRPDPVAASPPSDKGRGLGIRGGGAGPGQLPTGAQTFPGAAASRGTSSAPSGQTTTVIPAATVGHVQQARARHVRDAIRRALGLLDSDQQVIARRLLVDHGVDPDTGEVSGGDPGASRLAEPKLGQPLPREP